MVTGCIYNPKNTLTLPNCEPLWGEPEYCRPRPTVGVLGLAEAWKSCCLSEWGAWSTSLEKWTTLSPEGQAVKIVISDLLKANSAVLGLYPRNVCWKQSWRGKTIYQKQFLFTPMFIWCEKTFRQMDHFPSLLMSHHNCDISVFFPPKRSK